jgi:Ca2+-binding RTX toxin-like protein
VSIETNESVALQEGVLDVTAIGSVHVTLIGNALRNNIMSNSGRNIIKAGAGSDVVNGGYGNDTLYGSGGKAIGDKAKDANDTSSTIRRRACSPMTLTARVQKPQ